MADGLQKQAQYPGPPLPPEATDVDPKKVKEWTRELFPETRENDKPLQQIERDER